MTVAAPAGAHGSPVAAFADGHRVKAKLRRDVVVFALPARVGQAADWAVERLPR